MFVPHRLRFFNETWSEVNAVRLPLDILSEVENTYPAFYDTINHIGNLDWVNGESSYEANNLVSKLEDFQFVPALHLRAGFLPTFMLHLTL